MCQTCRYFLKICAFSTKCSSTTISVHSEFLKQCWDVPTVQLKWVFYSVLGHIPTMFVQMFCTLIVCFFLKLWHFWDWPQQYWVMWTLLKECINENITTLYNLGAHPNNFRNYCLDSYSMQLIKVWHSWDIFQLSTLLLLNCRVCQFQYLVLFTILEYIPILSKYIVCTLIECV